MRWTERQRAMLREMGVRLWEREPAAIAETATTSAVVADVAPVASPPPRVVSAPASTTAMTTPATTAAAFAGPAETMLPAADWLFVGEPLDGGSADGDEAQLLDNMLRAIGVARDGATRGRRASYLSLADPERRDGIRRAIDIVRPACIVALGRGAAQALLATEESLGSLRGRRHEHAGVAVFVTCPLAFVLRHADEKARVWAELCLAVAAADAARPD